MMPINHNNKLFHKFLTSFDKNNGQKMMFRMGHSDRECDESLIQAECLVLSQIDSGISGEKTNVFWDRTIWPSFSLTCSKTSGQNNPLRPSQIGCYCKLLR